MPPRKPAASSSSFASSSKPSKRGKFDDPDPELEDLAGGGEEEDLEDVKGRKDGVKQEGYDSDSSDDGEGVVPSRKLKPTADGEDSDDDMFGDQPAKPSTATTNTSDGKKKKEPKFLSLGEIEGQEFGAGGDDDDDEGNASEDSKDGMGFELSSFNMKNELREGAFTEEGAYVTNDKDRMEVHDRWMEGVDTKATMRELVREIVGMLERGETVVGALKRLGGTMDQKEKGAAAGGAAGGKKLSWAERQKERKKALAEAAEAAASSAGGGGGMEVDGAASTHHDSPFERLSTITSDLTALGQLDLYSMTKEALQRLLPPPPPTSTRPPPPSSSSSGPPPSAPPPDDGSQYEYRYTMDYIKSLPEAEKPVEREVFGPFPKPSILQWRAQGFFGGIGGTMEKVELRKVGGPSGAEWALFWSLFG
ncbi:hypothetical protein BDY24DRAFT_253566 [Mrakia frigida]|uniref:uncharacterized protein n=1 Tax=Mrakia frigida TaxID=29902 RepID=UPI003FCC0191